jgi:hypothetical protein
MTVPIYEHDCSNCRYIGTDEPRSHNEKVSSCNGVDMYVCGSGPLMSVIRRRSSDGPDYSSAPRAVIERSGVDFMDSLMYTLTLAKTKGLIL